MSSGRGHKNTGSVSQNHKAQLANAYNELGKELSSTKIRVVGNYTLGKVIGEGAYGKVRMGTHRLTSTRVAIKQIPKAMSATLTREIHHHRQLHHPHIAQMYEVIATEAYIWIVTELCCGGELYDYLAEKGRLSEEESRIIFGQLCLAVAYLHDNGIVHRDLKLENVLLDEHCRVKLGDFGFTREFERGSLMETFCGTTGYASPEMLQGMRYQGPEVDVWSLGIILYCLLTGTLPFDDDSEEVMREMIIRGDFEDPGWLSLESRNLIQKILQKDVTSRFSIPQILAHPWFTSQNLNFQTTSPLPTPERSLTTGKANKLPALENDGCNEVSLLQPTSASDINGLNHVNSGNHRFSTSDYDLSEKSEATTKEEITFPSLPRHQSTSSISKEIKGPPLHSVRTPARTKRRSISSNLSDPESPIAEKGPSTPISPPSNRDVDFASLLSTPAPIIFSTPPERQLLNSLSLLGFDTAQIVHSVLSNACDAAGAVWWMLKKLAEKKSTADGNGLNSNPGDTIGSTVIKSVDQKSHKKRKMSVGVQTDYSGFCGVRSAPHLAFIPATPTVHRPVSPNQPASPTRAVLLSPSDASIKSHPSTPAGSLRDKEAKARKSRSGSVSIMQRATTALEAAGLVKKKSSEAVRDDKPRDRSREVERLQGSGDEPRNSHCSYSSSKLTKSPPLKPSKEHSPSSTPRSTPPSDTVQARIDSPWVLAEPRMSASHPNYLALASSNTLGDISVSSSTPNFQTSTVKASAPPQRNSRASLLTTLRLWFHEDRKGKRKDVSTSGAGVMAYNWSRPNSKQVFNPGATKRRGFGSRGHRQRPSGSSRRSSSVNSRRSSGASMHMLILDSPQIPSRRSFGSHTPNSERGDYSSRPSSIQSFSTQQRHKKSPSQSSVGSARLRAASPFKYHKKGDSGTSTRVVRSQRMSHIRSNSATSSLYSPPSSRPTSFYEASEGEHARPMSPYRSRNRRSLEETPRRPASSGTGTTFVAQKRQAPFSSPATYTHGRSSWKKSWGMEPPGWRSRRTHLPVEVVAISSAVDPILIRDVFSGRQTASLGDESDWVDEDEDIPAFAGGLGQLSAASLRTTQVEPAGTVLPMPWVNRSSLQRVNSRGSGGSTCGSAGGTRPKVGHTPPERISPIPMENTFDTSETRNGRRQLPNARSGPAFRQAIQEEDEDEE